MVVVGAGVMGHGIAEVASLAGYEVTMVDVSDDFLAKGLEKIRWSLEKFVEKKRVTKEQADAALRRIKTSTNLADAVKDADLVIEAVPENISIKREIFATVSRNAPQHALLATNTSTLPISEIAAATDRPDKVVGMHFFNPPPMMPLLEIIAGIKTSRETIQQAVEIGKKMGKTVVLCRKDVPGFIVNRILMPLMNYACTLVKDGIYSVVEIDSALKYRAGLPMGIFELADYTGIDVIHFASKSIQEREPQAPEPCPLFKELFERGHYGMKSGKGFYQYAGGSYERPSIPREAGEKVDVVSVLAPAINSAAWIVRNDVASVEDVETAVKLGLGWPKGVFEMADEFGLDAVHQSLQKAAERYGTFYSPDPMITELVKSGKLGQKTGQGFHSYVKAEQSYSEIIFERRPPIARIVLNRPHRLNTITPKMIQELTDVLMKVWNDGEIRVVVIRGAGERAFSAGADVTAFTEVKTKADAERFLRDFQEVMNIIEAMPKPVIAGIDGFALGGGCELIQSCDIRIATDRSEFGQPEINLGLIPGAGGTQRLPRLVGIAKALELELLGTRITAEEAFRIGLVNKVVKPEKLEEELAAIAEKLAAQPPLAVRAVKQLILMAREAPMSKGLAAERMFFADLIFTKDFMEGISAFFAKRKPEFKGE
ncbi:MAG: 3-hydroxyacyl-CoA dehydrogenase/enoyl-CoA hydratase family protein [Candidatus Caldarchaeum sp.]|nr:3-hydroxyacyl-CoA dehydrogenase/enoyl-CoA hydratase family protein [Candidatus Caldarchaeum sp.]MDW8435507.1 3-hydroxyacyl-CoA dehydrogenase/enoyl-CoA hydratase family protein [Candidatus Caldarchaeum sp.]